MKHYTLKTMPTFGRLTDRQLANFFDYTMQLLKSLPRKVILIKARSTIISNYETEIPTQSPRRQDMNGLGHRRTRRGVGDQGNSVFQGKRKLLKNSECKKYIPYSEKFLGNSVFQGKRKLLKTPE